MKENLLIILPALLLASLTSGHGLHCYCIRSDRTTCYQNSTCETNGKCFVVFSQRPGESITEDYGCYSLDQLRHFESFCDGVHNSNIQVTHCCNNGSECNRNFINPFSVTSPPTVEDNTLAVTIAVPVSIIIIILIIVTVAITLIAVRFRKKRIENARRAGMDDDLSCDMQPRFSLDEYTDTSGSGFGMPHLEQRTLARNVKLGELIGMGRYGQVLLGDYQGEKVAVKKFSSIDGQSWQRETEVYTTNLLQHDNILQFIGCDMISNSGATELWLITQYHPHGSLYDYLNNNELSTRDLVPMMRSICSGLAHLHTELFGTIKKAAIAHRDIKTKNILVKNDLKCCIADFGLAALKGNDEKLNVPKNPKQGTKRYMAPEILAETINMNYFESFQHTDIYALGLVMWEMCRRLAGTSGSPTLDYEPPFHGLVPPDPSFEEMKRIVVIERRQPSVPPRWCQDQLLKNLLQLMRECWSYKSDARPTAVYLKKKLSKLSDEEKIAYEKTIE